VRTANTHQGGSPAAGCAQSVATPHEISYSYWPEVWENILEARRAIHQAAEEHADA
jgi:hypothetical protein